jgi:OOP family OmpA-OmpF porin
VPPPEPKPAKRYTLSAEMLFAFGGSQPKHLAERGRREIMALAKQLQEDLQASDVVLVQGHTDPTGSAGLNQRLSAERADTVLSILRSQGIPARQLRAQGLGSSELLVKDCAALHPTRGERIACDLPNRRVEITVAPSKN